MAFNVDLYDVEKYYFKWLRLLGCVERTWVQFLCMPLVYKFNCFIVLRVCLRLSSKIKS